MLSPMLWPARACSLTNITSIVARMSFVMLTPSRATYASVSSALLTLPSLNFDVHNSMSTGSNFMLSLIAAASSSKYGPRGPFMNRTSWIPSVIEEFGTHCPVSIQMYACLVSTLTPSAPRQPPAPLPVRTFEPGWVTVVVAAVAGTPGLPPGTATVTLGTNGALPGQARYSPPDVPPPVPQVISPTSRPQT